MSRQKIAINKNLEKPCLMFLYIKYDKAKEQWITGSPYESHILRKLKLALEWNLHKPDPPSAYDLLLIQASKCGLGLETDYEEEAFN